LNLIRSLVEADSVRKLRYARLTVQARGRYEMKGSTQSNGAIGTRDEVYLESVAPECFYRGPDRKSPGFPLKTCGNDGARKELSEHHHAFSLPLA
jgi:hypothetical protein